MTNWTGSTSGRRRQSVLMLLLWTAHTNRNEVAEFVSGMSQSGSIRTGLIVDTSAEDVP